MGLNDFFTGYHTQMKASKQATLNADFVTAINKLPDYSKSHNSYVLSKLEAGRLYYLTDDWEKSRKALEQAYEEIAEQNNAAKYQISSGLKNVGSVLSNDNALQYRVPSYEQGMLHSYQALNYLFAGNIESALVEVRRANLVQEQALSDNQKLIDEAKDSLKSEGMDVSRLYSSYPDMSGVIGSVKNSFQNAFTFYLSALLYEINGDTNDAYIDYKKALEINQDNAYIQKDVWRLANDLQMVDDLAQFKHDFDELSQEENAAIENGGEVILLIEQGVVHSREDVSINLPVFTRHDDLRFFSFSLPVYRGSSASMPVEVFTDGDSYASQEIVQIQSLAAKALKDELPWLVARQVVRVVAKEEMRRKMSREGGDIGNIVASLYNISSEKADTRSWSTLPSNVQIVRLKLPVGRQALTIRNNRQSHQIPLDVTKNSFHVLNVTDIGNKIHVREKTF